MSSQQPTKNRWWQYARIVAQQIPATDIPKDFARSEIKLCKQIGADTLFMFVELDGEYIFPTSLGPRLLRKRDLLRELVTECKDNGLRFVAAFMGQHVQTHLARKHPDWAFRGFRDLKAGKCVTMGPTCLCLNSPYGKLLQGMAREVIEGYGVDGIYFDGAYYPPQFCFCNGCRQRYKELFGKKMPEKLRDENRIKLGEETMVAWSREIRELINETNPDVCFALDCHATIIGHADSREYIHKTYDYVDVRVQECYPELISEHPYYAEMESRLIAAETGKTVWWAKWIARNSDTDVICNPPASVRLWGAGTLATKSPVFFVLQRCTDFDKRCIPPMKEISRVWARAKADMRDAETVAPVALFHSIESKLQRLPLKARENRQCFEGWYLALNNSHIPFDVVSEVGLSADALRKYSLLILPNTRYMSDGVMEHVKNYANEGGALIATGLTSFSDENGNDRTDFGLARVFGVTYTGTAEPARCGERDLTQYYRAFARHPIARGLEGDFYSFGGAFPRVKLARQAAAIFRTAAYDPKLLATGRFFVSYPTRKGADTVLCAREKPNRVVYIPAPIDSGFWDNGWPELAEIMRNAVVWALKGKHPIETSAEENVWMTLYRNERRKSWILHLNNQGINNQNAIGYTWGLGWDQPDSQSHRHPVRTCFTTGGFSVLLKSIKSKQLNVRSLNGKKPTVRKTARGWVMEHPGISEYDVVILQEK